MSRRGQDEVVEFAEGLGWTSSRPNKKGYIKLKCPCGRHQTWVHKTPSNPNYWKERKQFIGRVCGDASLHGGES